MSAFLGLLSTVLFFIGLVGLFRPIKSLKITSKMRASGVMVVSLLVGLAVGAINDINRAEELGFDSVTEMHAAEQAKRDAAAAKEAAAEAAAKRAEEERVAAKKAEEKRKGFHCLSAWDGSYGDLEDYVKERLRDPESFEDIETRISPVSDTGTHTVIMKYRARNGFGGMNVSYATAEITNDKCQMLSATVE
jgi:hypothetical protein